MDNKIITIFDPYINPKDIKYEKNILNIDKLTPTTIIFGQTQSGKSSILFNLLLKKLAHEIELNNIHIFS